MIKRALLSVSDKTGIVDFAKGLMDLGYELISTGGTEKALSEAGLQVLSVSQLTGFPECLDGRLKTLHPVVHGGLLAMRDDPKHMAQLEELGINTIDIAVINLYPFRQTVSKPGATLEDAIENIDIGGPAMLRAAAKNWKDVIVVTDPADYGPVLEALANGTADRAMKFRLSAKVFEHTANYDAMIAQYLRSQYTEDAPEYLTVTYEKVQDLRYGENPHQKAAFYREPFAVPGTIAFAKQLHGKELSYNNISDADAAISMVREFDIPCAVAVKHANPCGIATGETIYEAYTKAYEADPVSIFGGIVALNRECDLETAQELSKIFLEIIVAPSFSTEALAVLEAKKNIRLLELPGIDKPLDKHTILKKVGGGMLMQDADIELGLDDLKVVTDRAPTAEELKALTFGWRVVKHTKSNAIVLTSDSQTLGIGPGQTNRITALELAIKYAGEQAKGSCMASDAFFPFRDCVEAAHKAGITAIIQPGGSIRDQESIDACNEYGIAMVFTGMRHFKH